MLQRRGYGGLLLFLSARWLFFLFYLLVVVQRLLASMSVFRLRIVATACKDLFLCAMVTKQELCHSEETPAKL